MVPRTISYSRLLIVDHNISLIIIYCIYLPSKFSKVDPCWNGLKLGQVSGEDDREELM